MGEVAIRSFCVGLSLALAGCRSESEPPRQDASAPPVQDAVAPWQGPTSAGESLAPYEIASVSRTASTGKSFAARIVVTKNPVSVEELRGIGVQVVLGLSAERPEEVTAWFYFHRDQVDGPATLGTGSWTTVAPNDFKLVTTARIKRVAGEEPTEDERLLEKRFKAKFREAGGAKTDEEVANDVAAELGIARGKVLKAHQKVALYDAGL